jgi:hypothetical protein
MAIKPRAIDPYLIFSYIRVAFADVEGAGVEVEFSGWQADADWSVGMEDELSADQRGRRTNSQGKMT